MKAAATKSKALDVQPDCHIRCRKSGIMSRLKNLRPHKNLNHPYFRFSNVNLSGSPGGAQAFSAVKIGGKGMQRKLSKMFPKKRKRQTRKLKTSSSSSCSGVKFLAETNELEKVSAWFETMPKQLFLEEETENMKDDENVTLECQSDDSNSNQSEKVSSAVSSAGESTVDDGSSLERSLTASVHSSAATELPINGPEHNVEDQSEPCELSRTSSFNASGTTEKLKCSVLNCWKAKAECDSLNCKPVGFEKEIHEGEGAIRIPEDKPKKETLQKDNVDEIEHLTSLLNRSSRRKSRMRSIFSLKGHLGNSASPNSFATRLGTLFHELFSKCYGNRASNTTRNQVGPADAVHQQLPMPADINNNVDTHTNLR